MTSQSSEQLRVLVVDDEAPARQRIVDLLKKDALELPHLLRKHLH